MKTCQVMGILNITPDSFSDGGHFLQLDLALKHVEKMINDGADFIDIGGESTRPGAAEVNLDEELNRVIPVIDAIKQRFDIPLSIDTYKPTVMRAAAKAGVDMINDVFALRADGALSTAASLNIPICIMHMQGTPHNMQDQPSYSNVIDDVKLFLIERIDACIAAGIKAENIIIDPGFGFGKTLQHNLNLLAALDQFSSLGYKLLTGLSRKSMIGQITNKPTEHRLAGSLAGALIAASKGANILRVHDVVETVDALKVMSAVNRTTQGI